MSHYDVFNGDADGICALHQLRLAQPLAATLVTGVKRDIELLRRVDAQAGDGVTVLDISLDRNRAALLALLARGVRVEYFDHHFAGGVPRHANLTLHLDPAPGVCTSVLVDAHLRGRYRPWAVVAAFGDGLDATALALAQTCGLAPLQAQRLCDLGQALNYNAYGDTEADLLVAPARLYQAMHRHHSPFDFLDADPLARLLDDGRRQDLEQAVALDPAFRLPAGSVYLLPDAAWARRVQGVFANALAQRSPQQAHAVLSPAADGGLTVSVRAPLARPEGADRLCRRYPGGGGRAAAAGIDGLPREQLPQFVRDFGAAFRAPGDGEGSPGSHG
jgi:hypothetical protein